MVTGADRCVWGVRGGNQQVIGQGHVLGCPEDAFPPCKQ